MTIHTRISVPTSLDALLAPVREFLLAERANCLVNSGFGDPIAPEERVYDRSTAEPGLVGLIDEFDALISNLDRALLIASPARQAV